MGLQFAISLLLAPFQGDLDNSVSGGHHLEFSTWKFYYDLIQNHVFYYALRAKKKAVSHNIHSNMTFINDNKACLSIWDLL